MIEIYTDGSSNGRSNSPGGWGIVVVKDDVEIYRLYGGEKATTNNRMELMAVIKAMEAGLQFSSTPVISAPIIIYSDSQYAINITLGKWSANKNFDLVEKARDMYFLINYVDSFGDHCGPLAIRWIKGHSGHKWNDLVDKLAKLGKEECLKSTSTGQ